jgi:ATP-binding cassette, subfamily F, member 3
MTVLTLRDIDVSFGGEDVLEGITASVNAGDRIGLVGRNGAGKTTLLHVLAGDLAPGSGQRHLSRGLRVALVEQVPPASESELTVREEALAQLGDLIQLEAELSKAAQVLQSGRPGAADAYATLQHRFELAGGFTYESRLNQVLSGLGFAAEDGAMPVSTLSGGQRSRLGLAKALLADPDLLLMDEPTNHLDFAGLRWLEDFLRRWQGTLIVTSHDRYFLDRVAGRVWFLEGRHLRAYRGNYYAFHEQREREIARQKVEHEAQQEFIAREEAFIRRYRAGQRAREARGRAKRLARLERVEGLSKSRDAVIKLTSSRAAEVVISTRAFDVGYGTTPLLHIGEVEVGRGARIALIGPNGTGKTTLLRTLAGELAHVAGTLSLGANVRLAHYWQEAEDLDASGSVLDELLNQRGVSPQQARDLLGMMLFSGDDVDKPVAGLSGGERSRLALAKLVLSRANVLLLDEPTNHLDIPSREALEAALAAYEGTIIFASHDRRLISSLADRLWLAKDGAFRTFDGTFDEFQEAQAPAVSAKPALPREPHRRPSAYEARRREAALVSLEAEIERREQELADLGREINDASAAGDLDVVSSAGKHFDELRAEIDRLVSDWTQIQS